MKTQPPPRRRTMHPNETNFSGLVLVGFLIVFGLFLLIGLVSYNMGHTNGYKAGKREATVKHVKDLKEATQKHVKDLEALKKRIGY